MLYRKLKQIKLKFITFNIARLVTKVFTNQTRTKFLKKKYMEYGSTENIYFGT